MQLLYSSIISIVIAVLVSWFFYWKSESLILQLTKFLIEVIGKKDVKPIFKRGKLIGKAVKAKVKITGGGTPLATGVKNK